MPTYDLKPEMSAVEMTNLFLEKITKKRFDFSVINFANPDMVGHTGSLPATIKACETVDFCLSKIVPFILKNGGTIFITGDHGNAEELIDSKTGGVDTEHSSFPVPFIAVNKKWEGKSEQLPRGILADIAPTILAVMHIPKPKTMTGRNLLENIVD